jgi:putative 4-mercaptohistidine N1-methyltranferase
METSAGADPRTAAGLCCSGLRAWPALYPAAAACARRRPLRPRAGIDHPAAELRRRGGDGASRMGKPARLAVLRLGQRIRFAARCARARRSAPAGELVSNGEFHEFVVAGGYREQKVLGRQTGWAWRRLPQRQVADLLGARRPGRARTATSCARCSRAVAMPWDWPAEVNASRGARLLRVAVGERDGVPYRLPSEAEHNALRDPVRAVADDPVMAFDGAALSSGRGWNLNLAHGSSSPVDAGRPSAAGFHDVFGNVWQWMEDHFNPLPGAEVHPYYDDFSSPCYDGQHQMILGGAWVSTGDEASVWSRFHFRPHFFQHAGFRLVQAAHDGGAVRLDTAGSASRVYEDAQMLNDYLLLHYGAAQQQMPWAFGPQGATGFPQRCAQWLLEGAKAFGAGSGTALDIGCAVGRASFELARGYGDVTGVDLSRAFIEAASRLQRDGELHYFRRDEGELGADLSAIIDPAIDRSRVNFRQADATSLPADWLEFDAVLMANLLCRLPSPKSLLGRLGGPRGLVKVGGLVALFSPYTWLEQFTPRGAWLGGLVRDGKPVKSADALREFLTHEGFELRREEEVPLVIREHARKYQYIVTHGMLWQRLV